MLVNKAYVEAEWPTVAHKFPGVEVQLIDTSADNEAQMVVTGATLESVAYALNLYPRTEVVTKPARHAVAADFSDHGRERVTGTQLVEVTAQAEPFVEAGSKGEKVEVEKKKRPPKKKDS